MANESNYDFVLSFISDNLKELIDDIKLVNNDLENFEKFGTNAERTTEKLNDSTKDLNKSLKDNNKEVEKRRKLAQENLNKINQEVSANNKLEGSFSRIFKKLVSIGAIYSIAHKAMNFYNEGLELDELSRKTGVLRDELQNLSQAGKAFNISSETTATSITKAQEYYKKTFGISTTGENAYEAIARKMQGMSRKQQYEFGAKIGLDEGTIALLSQGVEKYRQQVQEASNYKLFDEDDINKMREYRQSMGQLRLGFNQLFGILARALLPVFNAILKPISNFFKFLSKHEGIVKTIAVYAGLAGILVGLPKLIGMVAGAWKLLNATFLTSPIGWIVAGLTAIFLIVNDFINFLQGNDTVIEKILKSWGVDVEKVRKTFNNFFDNIAKGISKFIDGIKKIIDALRNLKNTQDNMNGSIGGPAHNTLPANSKTYSTPADKPKQSTMADKPNNINKTTNNTKNVNIANVNIQTQNMSPDDVKRTITSIDNGIAG